MSVTQWIAFLPPTECRHNLFITRSGEHCAARPPLLTRCLAWPSNQVTYHFMSNKFVRELAGLCCEVEWPAELQNVLAST